MQKRRNDVNILIAHIYLHTIPIEHRFAEVTLSLSSTENSSPWATISAWATIFAWATIS